MADEWHWSEWITPSPVALTAYAANGLAGAGGFVTGTSDPDVALHAVRIEGAATTGGFNAPDGPPYSYASDSPRDAGSTFQTSTMDRAYGFTTGDGAFAYADLEVGYANGYWRERPDYRDLPAEFLELAETDYVPIDPTKFGWERVVEFEPGVDTVAVEWADVWTNVAALAGPNGVGGSLGYATGILLPPTVGWTGSFGSWPPPLGGQFLSWPASTPPPDQPLPVKPSPGSDFTVTIYTDMAINAPAPDENWQEWFLRLHNGPLGPSLHIWYQMPRFRYRIPGPGLSPRFFVKDLDGVMRPVGFGKPATETAVFRVPTAVGMYRDLTTTEYATYGPDARPPGGYPLKVKRRDTDGADWWDHVAWMVPVAE